MQIAVRRSRDFVLDWIKYPADESVFQCTDKKRAEGKHYYVFMMAAANKCDSPRGIAFVGSGQKKIITLHVAEGKPRFSNKLKLIGNKIEKTNNV
jgi:hypothetical protein